MRGAESDAAIQIATLPFAMTNGTSHMSNISFAFLGSPSFAATILAGLLEAGWVPALVITEPPKPVGRRQTLTPTAVQTYAESRGLPVTSPRDRDELFDVILRLGARQGEQPVEKSADDSTESKFSTQLEQERRLDLLVVAAYGRILTQAMLDLPRCGAVNVHASLLPKYRGASPIQGALLAGETKTGITFMQMEAGLDTGPIIAQFPVAIAPTETTVTLAETLAAIAAAQIAPVLTDYLSYRSNRVNKTYVSPQDSALATDAPKLTKQDGIINLTTIDPVTLDRMVRALNPWPGVVSHQFGVPLRILEGHLDGADQYTITKLQWAGKAPVDGATLARAYPNVLTALPDGITLGANNKVRS